MWRDRGVDTHSFGLVEETHTYVTTVVATEVDEVDGGTNPEVDAWQPHQHSVLETLGEVGSVSVQRMVPILSFRQKKTKLKLVENMKTSSCSVL